MQSIMKPAAVQFSGLINSFVLPGSLPPCLMLCRAARRLARGPGASVRPRIGQYREGFPPPNPAPEGPDC